MQPNDLLSATDVMREHNSILALFVGFGLCAVAILLALVATLLSPRIEARDDD